MRGKKLAWLLDEEYEPKGVTVHTNKELSHKEFDEQLLESYGYKKGATVHYNVKQGKTTLLGNPEIHKGL